jgi:cbb3-type cytochrome oxidase maturation protein
VDVVILLVFVSLVLVAAGLVFFVSRLREGDFDHGERLALSPLANDDGSEASVAPQSKNEKNSMEKSEGGALHVGS